VIEIDISKAERANWRELIPHGDETLRGAGMLNNEFVANYLKDAHSQIKIFSRDAAICAKSPCLGSARRMALG